MLLEPFRTAPEPFAEVRCERAKLSGSLYNEPMVENNFAADREASGLFQPLVGPNVTRTEIWKWWEQHRFFYNLLIVAATVVSFVLYAFFIRQANVLVGGEDLVEPIAYLFALTVLPVFWNLCYCLGPLVDICMSSDQRSFGPEIWKVGMTISIAVISIPAIYWGLYLLHQQIKTR